MKIIFLLFTALLSVSCQRSLEAVYQSTGFEGSHGNTRPDPGNRDSVSQAYKAEFERPYVDPQWTGSFQNCDPGTTSIEFQQSVIDRISFYRQLAGLSPVKLVANSGAYQAAALIMGANGNLSHHPDSSWRCYSQDGAGGAGSSNIALGAYGPGAIDLYIDDHGGNNQAVGHRRWILLPGRTHFATGDVPGGGGSAANSLSVWESGDGSVTPVQPDVVAWPPAGYVPRRVLPAGSTRWSFAYTKGNISNAQVRMRNVTDNQDIPVQLEPFYSGYGQPTLVWLAPGVNYRRSGPDTVYRVTIDNIQVSGSATSYSYDVIVFDP